MNKQIIKVGIVGSGFAARFHFEALRRVFSANIKVVGAYSPNRERLDSFTSERNIQSFSSLEDLIDACDVLHLCTPPVTHEPMAIEILNRDKSVVIEKPLTGYFGDGNQLFNGDTFSRETGYRKAVESIQRMIDAEKKSKGKILYAENWVYAPAIQKEREVIEKTKAQVLWMQAQQSHSGSHSADYGKWYLSGGGSLMGKGSHALAGVIYMKHVEGRVKNGIPIRPKTVSARVHALTRMPGFQNQGHLRDSYTDIEDYASAHIVFEDGTVAEVLANELTHGGSKNNLEVHANNHRTICNIGPNNAMQTYNPVEDNFRDVYVVEKTGTKQGWSNISPDENWFNGYQHEMDAFYLCLSQSLPVESDSALAADVISTIYAAYLSAERKGLETEIVMIA